MKTDSEIKKYNTNATEKTLSVIDFLFCSEATFTDIQNALHIPKATLHRILLSLENHDFISKNSLTEKYSLGNKFIYYGETTKSQRNLTTISEEYVKKLAEVTGESACLSVYYHGVSISLVSAEGDSTALTSKLIPFSPLNCSASGKIFLSLLDEKTMENYFETNTCIPRTVNTITTLQDFLPEKEKILEQKISFDDEEYEYGLFCVSVPLESYDQTILASVGITGPKARIMMKGLDSMVNEVKSCSDKISAILKKMRYQFEF
ncbi:IclR family transcriptional regulator [Guggenheimella bovis]